MSTILNVVLMFFGAVLTGIVLENAVFTRALGLTHDVLFLKSPKSGILYGSLLTVTITIASLFIPAINFFLADSAYVRFVRAPAYFLCIALVYCLVWFGSQRYHPQLHLQIRTALPVTTFNSALFGAFYVCANQNFGFFETVGYAIGTGIGYTGALLIVYYARKRLAISPVPRSFRGLPILLLYIGLLSLGFYGLIGHGLLA